MNNLTQGSMKHIAVASNLPQKGPERLSKGNGISVET